MILHERKKLEVKNQKEDKIATLGRIHILYLENPRESTE